MTFKTIDRRALFGFAGAGVASLLLFGRRITISYLRDQTAEEAECERRYVEAEREAKARELERLQAELGVVCYAAPGKRGKLRIVG